MYTEHTTETLMPKLSPVGRVVRQAMDEILRIRRVILTTRNPVGKTMGPTVPMESVSDGSQTYRGPLDRPQRPETPFYDSPLPLHETPEVREFLRRRPLWSGPEDPDGLPADHPDLIWSFGVRYKQTPGINPPPLEIRHWSMHYRLPVGLHRDWRYISPIAYGGRLDMTPAKRAQFVPYVRRTYPGYAVPQLPSPKRSAAKVDTFDTSSKPRCTSPGEVYTGSTEHHVEDKAEKSLIAPSPACKTEIIGLAEPPVAASVSPLRPLPITDVYRALPSTTLAPSRTLKRSRADGHDDSVGRPAKRIAVNELSTRKLSPLPRNPPDTPIATTSASYTTAATESPSSFGISLEEHHSKTPGRCRDPRVANAPEPSATIDTAPVHAREEARAPKRKRDAEVDEDTASGPHAKRSRAIQPLQSVRRSLRVREKAAIVP
ncbi:hypothetical protein PENSPDRAFT_267438 [Peniophora sp. CONT]|nr:hypothetical protein PENSPDRAFT_267438 [Peniophora sp. CONT]